MVSNLRYEYKYSPIPDFDFKLLDDPQFKEDSVREEILFPIIKALGCSASGKNRIIRSKNLLHPFVAIGCQQKQISIVPDYVMAIEEKPSWILEAKAPNIVIKNTVYNEQAYSYAIHPEIPARYYALSNGRRFTLYSVDDFKPIFDIDMRDLSSTWEEMRALLSPENFNKNWKRKLAKDFGLHIKRIGFDMDVCFYFYDMPVDFIQKINDDLFTVAMGIEIDNTNYVALFDFNSQAFQGLYTKIPDKVFHLLQQPINGKMFNVKFQDARYRLSAKCNLGQDLQENNDEIFLPLRVIEFI